MAQGYKKINHDDLSKHSFRMSDYFTNLDIHLARLQFKLNSLMTPKVASNFHRNPRYKANNYMCVGCSLGEGGDKETNLDSEQHILICKSYSRLRENLDLNKQTDLLKYFQLVIQRRTEEEEQ